MRQASATHPRTITAVAIENCATQGKTHIGRTRQSAGLQSSRASLASISVSLSRARHDTPNPRSVDDSAPLLRAQLTGKRAPTPCHDTGLAGWADPVRRIPLSNKGLLHCVHAFVLSEERAPPPTTHHAIVSRRPVANPPNRLHATGADRRTSLTSLYVSPSCGVPRDGTPLCEGIKKGREGIEPHRV